MTWHQERRWRFKKKIPQSHRKLRIVSNPHAFTHIHQHLMHDEIIIPVVGVREHLYRTLEVRNIHILSMWEFRWWCGTVTLCCILTDTRTTWNCLACRDAQLQHGSTWAVLQTVWANCVWTCNKNPVKLYEYSRQCWSKNVCNSLGSSVGATCEFDMHSILSKHLQI